MSPPSKYLDGGLKGHDLQLLSRCHERCRRGKQSSRLQSGRAGSRKKWHRAGGSTRHLDAEL